MGFAIFRSSSPKNWQWLITVIIKSWFNFSFFNRPFFGFGGFAASGRFASVLEPFSEEKGSKPPKRLFSLRAKFMGLVHFLQSKQGYAPISPCPLLYRTECAPLAVLSS
ncbi:MAG: hypothetical protein ACI4JZ_09950 [Oscillospiraceae bacterium]